MSNPILDQLNARAAMPNNLGQIKQMLGTLRAAKDPNALLAQMAGNNPQMRQAIQLINQSGGDAKSAFYALAKKQGVDPNMILNMLK